MLSVKPDEGRLQLAMIEPRKKGAGGGGGGGGRNDGPPTSGGGEPKWQEYIDKLNEGKGFTSNMSR